MFEDECSHRYLCLHQLLSRSVMGVLIILSVLELCVTISCAVLGIKSLKNREKTENMGESEKSEQAAALLP